MNQTHWPRVWIAFLAGCIGAFQIGKTFASLTLIIDELALSLVQAGLILSLFSLIAAFAGAGFGLLSDRVGHLYMALTGLLLSASGAFLGAKADGIELLLMSRLIEGLGFILAIVALPSLISRSASDRSRPLAMGIWGAFHIDVDHPAPAGMAWLARPVERCRIHYPDLERDSVYRFPRYPEQILHSFEHRGFCREHFATRPAVGGSRFRLLFQPLPIANRFSADHPGNRLQRATGASRSVRRPGGGRQRDW
jgi:hypothetical protein